MMKNLTQVDRLVDSGVGGLVLENSVRLLALFSSAFNLIWKTSGGWANTFHIQDIL